MKKDFEKKNAHENEHHHYEHHHDGHSSCGCDHGHAHGHDHHHGREEGHEHSHSMSERDMKIKLFRVIVSAALLALAAVLPIPKKFEAFLLLIPYLIAGFDVLLEGAEVIFKGQVLDENFLMSVATIGAFILRENYEAVFVMIFYQIGELFQGYATNRSKNNIRALMDLRSDKARVESDEGQYEIPCADVEVGREIIVKPGEKIPLDGIITFGETQIDLSALTGESLPKDEKVGSEVFSGTVNLSNLIRVKTTKEFKDSTASKIIDMIENSKEKKAKTEKFITRFSKVYTPVVCICALLIALIPVVTKIFTGYGDFSGWIMQSLTFLVISCPCALVMSIPLGFFGGIGASGKKGVLVRNGESLEKVKGIKTIIFDKTGTLTKGSFFVADIITSYDEREALMYASYCEANSNHPLGKAIVKRYGEEIDFGKIESFENFSGYGAIANAFSKTIAVGNRAFMEKLSIECPENNDSLSAIYLAVDGKFFALFLLRDELKNETKSVIASLKDKGIRTVMLTGDRREVGEAIAKESGVDEFHCELLPEDKLVLLQRIKDETDGFTAFVGDGINDAPAITESDVGFAMGSLGQDAAIESADIVLMNDSLNSILDVLKISKKTMRIVVQNIVLSLGIKGICLILSIFRITNMWISIFADVGVMMIAVLNSLRTLKNK